MRTKLYLFALAAVLPFAGTALRAQSPYQPLPKGTDPVRYDGMQLVWHDEFDIDGRPGPDWSYELGFVRNEEHQWYKEENCFVENGVLVLEGRRETVPNPNYDPNARDWKRSRKVAEYTSGSVNTRRSFTFKYGRLEVRAKIPVEKGSWPAIWTLGNRWGWPFGGEVDVMEYYLVNDTPTLLANAAWGDAEGRSKWSTTYHALARYLEKDPQWLEKYHVWTMDWTPERIVLYMDGEVMNSVDLKQTFNGGFRGNYENPFSNNHPDFAQYILLDYAIGGQNGGDPSASVFPQRYCVDYVRVYQTVPPYTDKPIRSGEIWPDDRGEHINAHGGGILLDGDTYYWFGEHKGGLFSNAFVGITCYSSKDLVNWKYEGVALSVSDDPDSDIVPGCVMERPKVIFNAKTGKYVMWFHLELRGQGYSAARSGVAVSDKVTGPYTYLGSGRSNPGILAENVTQEDLDWLETLKEEPESWTEPWLEAIRRGMYYKRDFEGGQMARDMTLFVDDDGKAYHIYAAEENLTLNIAELSDDYLSHSGRYVRVAPAGHNEAPAIFKRNGTYWMITSGCTGWDPNAARMFSAPSIFGPWTQHPNPCRGENAEITYGGQGTYILPVAGKKDCYIFMADIWRPRNPGDARYIWLPIQFEADGTPYLEWMDAWSLADK